MCWHQSPESRRHSFMGCFAASVLMRAVRRAQKFYLTMERSSAAPRRIASRPLRRIHDPRYRNTWPIPAFPGAPPARGTSPLSLPHLLEAAAERIAEDDVGGKVVGVERPTRRTSASGRLWPRSTRTFRAHPYRAV